METEQEILKGVNRLGTQIAEIGEEVKAVETQTETLLKNYDQLGKDTKEVMEDLTKLKRVANDQQANADKFVLTLRRLEHQLRSESRLAFGDPVRRLMANEEKWNRFNAYLRLAMGAKLGGKHKEALKSLGEDAGAPRELRELAQRALGEDSSPGSTVIDDRLFPEVYDTLATFGIFPTFAVKRLGTKETKFPIKTARVIAQMLLTESEEIVDDANKAGGQVTLTVELCACLLLVSEQLFQDAEIDLEADNLAEFAEAFAGRLDHLATNADGTADTNDGGMTGVFHGGTAAVAADGNTTVEGLQLDDVIRVLLAVDPIVLQRMAKWWLHPQILVRLLSIRDGNGRPIFLTANEAPSHGGIGSILGYPVVPSHAAPSTNAASAKVAVFGDPNGMVVGMRTDWAFDQSRDFKFNTYQRALRGVARVGTKIRRSQAFGVLTTAAA